MEACSLLFRVVDKFGHNIPYVVISYKDVESGKEWKDAFSGLSGKVPCGAKYKYLLTRKDMTGYRANLLKVEGTHWIEEPENPITLAGPDLLVTSEGRIFGTGDQAPFVVQGKIVPALKAAEVWIQFLSPYDPNRRSEAKVALDGSFKLYTPPDGLMVVVVSKGDEIVYVGKLPDLNQKYLVIDLSSNTSIQIPNGTPPI